MKDWKYSFIIVSCLFISSCGQQERQGSIAIADTEWEEALPDYINPEWAKDAIWDDGRGEVVYYSCFMRLEEKLQNFELVMITTKENLSHETNAQKHEGKGKTFEVLKHNQFASIKTEVFPHNFLSNFYFKRENPNLIHQATYSSQDWDGNVFKSLNYTSDGYHINTNSYLTGESERSVEDHPWLEDQLPFTLRSLKFEDGLSFRRKVMGSMMYDNYRDTVTYNAQFDVSQEEEQWEVKMTIAEGKETFFYFVTSSPYLMKQMVAYDGRRMLMTRANRSKYWLAPVPLND